VIIGVPREIKDGENRVAMTPAGVHALLAQGDHQVLVQQTAGVGSGHDDGEYEEMGARMVASPAEVYGQAEIVVKVKEPLPSEYDLLRPGQIIFTYLHLAASEELTQALMDRGVVAIAYETIQTESGALPLLVPMSEIAGKMAVQVGSQYLESYHGGRGILLGGVPGVPPGEVVILGCGVVGINATKVALGLGSQVTVLDKNLDRLRYLDDTMHGNIITVISNPYDIQRSVSYADLVVGAVLVAGAKPPVLVTEDMVKGMKRGAVIVDVAVDQGGCVETIRPTTHSEPTYSLHQVVHYGVTNMPAAVPRTSTRALTNATMPYLSSIVAQGLKAAVEADPALALGVNVIDGKVVHPQVAETFNLECCQLSEVLAARKKS